jgi:thiosulfate/3-mercaptopyruvate sulfurtransferase
MATSNSFGPLISADDLASELGAPDLELIDIRWSLADPTGGRKHYEEGHVPGAVFLDLEADITGAEGAGRHPLPTKEQFQAAMRRAGVNNSDRVVVYDDAGGSVAGRVWWLLRAHGHEAAAVLDGGVQAWTGELEAGIVSPSAGDFVAAEPDRTMWLDFDEVAHRDDGDVLIDVRAPERYSGETEPVDPVAGHIPGARNAFWQTNLAADGRYRSPAELRRRYEELGVTSGKAVVYCGSGVNACQAAIAIERAGLGPVRVYAGSWSDWSRHDDAPVATGTK